MPWNGKKQATCYFCSSSCFQASYKHIGWYDGKEEERRRLKDMNRSPEKRAEQWKRYYEKHDAEIRKKRMERYWQNREEEVADSKYYRQKRKLMEA